METIAADFVESIKRHQSAFGLSLDPAPIQQLADYYSLIQLHNPLLHLVGPCSAEEFAIRHILESLTLLKHLPINATLADVGAGAGLPSIPCLLVRVDLRAVLIESKAKKTAFLEVSARELGITDRVSIINRQFEESDAAESRYVTCRALDKFSDKLPRLLRWAGPRTLWLFGGENLHAALEANGVQFVSELMPMSERRFLFVIDRGASGRI
ncbi:MAG: RsmG family class I SAM-dependent methyltransferase [Pyrinomonadaceae bacterium]